MAYEWLGLVGLICILAGWIPETVETVRNRHCGLNMAFALLYFIGSGALAAYSLVLGDIIFLALNGVATLMALINLYFCKFGKKKR